MIEENDCKMYTREANAAAVLERELYYCSNKMDKNKEISSWMR